MDAQAVYEAAMQALSSRDGYFVELERLTGLTQVQVNTYHRDFDALSEEEVRALKRRHGVGGGLGFHCYLADRIAEGAGK